jgi:hypothetical protein
MQSAVALYVTISGQNGVLACSSISSPPGLFIAAILAFFAWVTGANNLVVNVHLQARDGGTGQAYAPGGVQRQTCAPQQHKLKTANSLALQASTRCNTVHKRWRRSAVWLRLLYLKCTSTWFYCNVSVLHLLKSAIPAVLEHPGASPCFCLVGICVKQAPQASPPTPAPAIVTTQ